MPTTFGCDCEFVLTLEGRYKSAVRVLKGTREKRECVEGHEIFHDNVLAEVAIQYGTTLFDVQRHFKKALQTLSTMVSPCKLDLSPCADYPEKELQDPDAREAGCSEETDAYTRETLQSQEETIKNTPFRTAGGHIHLGGNPALMDSIKVKLVVYALDLFVGIPSLFIDKNILSQERREMYGKAGSHREKPYGVEYRVLSPFWLRSPKTVELIYNLSMHAIDFVENGNIEKFWTVNKEKLFAGKKDAFECYGYDKNLIVKSINECDLKIASKFMMLIEEYLPTELFADIQKEINADPDFYESWNL